MNIFWSMQVKKQVDGTGLILVIMVSLLSRMMLVYKHGLSE